MAVNVALFNLQNEEAINSAWLSVTVTFCLTAQFPKLEHCNAPNFKPL